MVVSPTTNRTCHRPTTVELLEVSSLLTCACGTERLSLCTPPAAAISFKESPHDAKALALSPAASTMNAANGTTLKICLDFITLLLTFSRFGAPFQAFFR